MEYSKKTEEKFFDQHVSDPGQLKIYQNIQGLEFDKPFNTYFDSLIGEVQGKFVLEYGCGNYGDLSIKLAQAGAKVVAGDLSGESVKSTRSRVRKLGLDNQIATIKMDCENLCFPDRSFDLVVGRAILHHLDLEQACREIKRVLKPGGKAVFIEPMGMNPLINLYRYFTPEQRTPGEHPFTISSFKTLQKHFTKIEHQEFNLCPLFVLLLAGLFRDKNKLVRLLDKLQTFDNIIFNHVPPLSYLAWTTVIFCQ